ncbi:T9SS type A sorting domain-containing protein [Gramella sp. KN1008]|uniref:T9SS type A sorting domain-containing protein n=1 Tax=Gramella sp. KN1008 TaxID=2529298 RepID=UPI00103C2155|nr:T9SS type A sorting domain-containing protein [Gramella sp. KN1008]TBW29162.1 T9SS type A sorting domain-containing protein [Gramella sp. KN1008]
MPHPRLQRFLFLICCLSFFIETQAQNDTIISGLYTIPAGITKEYNNLDLNRNISDLRVNGTLIVYGDLTMSGNMSKFSMGDSAFVLVYGNFEASNQVNVSVSSYLIVQGNFIRTTGSNQGTLDIADGNIYIFGEVDGWPDDFTTCETYDGNTETRNDNCDFGTEDNLEENIETFPPEYTEKLNCYEVEDPTDQSSCIGGSVSFSVNQISGVNYQWQMRPSGGTEYTDIGTASTPPSLSLTGISSDMNGNQYRVVVRSQDTTASGCKITISKPATLTVQQNNEWTGAINSDWNTAGNWLCNSIPDSTSDISIPAGLTNYPVLNTGASGKVHHLNIGTGASLEILDNTLEISGIVTSTGSIDASSGKIKFNGSAAQTIPSGLLLNSRIKALEIDNSNGVTSNSTIQLTGSLKVTNGNFYTSDDFALISDNIQTALIDGSGTGEVIGNVIMQRFLDPAFGYKYLSSPLDNTVVGDLSDYIDLNASFPSFYRYNENRTDSQNRDASGWEAYTAATSPLNILEGYAANFGNNSSPLLIQLSGTVNNGPYQKNLVNHNRKYTKGFHLVGNPYPSPIDWDASTGWTRNNIDDAIYFFTADNTDQYTGTYSSYVNGVSSADGGSSNIIPSMQGFFVHVSDPPTGIYPATGSLGMTNEVRVRDFDQQFIKSGSEPKKLIRITAGYKDQKNMDAMVFYFQPAASADFEENIDALKLLNTNKKVPNLYSLSAEGKKLSINAISMDDGKIFGKYPLGVISASEGIISISLQSAENLPQSFNIYLIDEAKQTYVNLREQDYEFYSGKMEYSSRFYISFSPSDTPTPQDIFDEPFSLIGGSQEIIIKMNLKEHGKGVLRINNINGQLIELRKVRGNETINIRGIKSNGVYLVSYIAGEREFSKKVLVQK